MKKVLCLIVAMLMAFCMMTTVLAVDASTAAVDSPTWSDGDFGDNDSSDDDTSGSQGHVPEAGIHVITGTNGAADSDEKAPNTGDETNVVLWGSVFALSAGAAAILVANRRKAKAGK